jgi:hypothetical protein
MFVNAGRKRDHLRWRATAALNRSIAFDFCARTT